MVPFPPWEEPFSLQIPLSFGPFQVYRARFTEVVEKSCGSAWSGADLFLFLVFTTDVSAGGTCRHTAECRQTCIGACPNMAVGKDIIPLTFSFPYVSYLHDTYTCTSIRGHSSLGCDGFPFRPQNDSNKPFHLLNSAQNDCLRQDQRHRRGRVCLTIGCVLGCGFPRESTVSDRDPDRVWQT